MQKTDNIVILDSRKISVFIFSLKSKSFTNRIEEAIELLRTYYPYEVTKENIILKKNKGQRSYICIVFINNLKDEKEKFICTTVYAKNHFVKFTGFVYFEFCEDGYKEIVQMNNGNVEKVIFSKVKETQENEKVIKVTKHEILQSFKKRDVIYKDEKRMYGRKVIFIGFVFFIIILLTALLCKNYFNNLQTEIENKKQLIEIEKQKEEIKIKEEKRLGELQNEYSQLCENQFDNIYDYLCVLYSCIEKGSVIENLSIEKNNFSVDVTTTDAVKILKHFEEKSTSLSEVKMNRTVIQKNKDYVSYTGKFVKNVLLPKEDISTNEKIEFYQNEIRTINQKKEKMKEKTVSEYAKMLRERFQKHFFVEQYIQYRTDNNIVVLECSLTSSSSNILSFLENNKDDISRIQIRNSEEVNKVQTVINFWTGIEHKENLQKVFEKDEIVREDVTKLNSVFYKVPKKKEVQNVSVKQNVESKIQKDKNLTYVGKTKVKGKTVVIIKNTQMNNLYKLPLVNSESEFLAMRGNYCMILDSGKLKVCIKGNIFEVEQ